MTLKNYVASTLTDEEVEKILKDRETATERQMIAEKASQIVDLITEIEELGGSVMVDKVGKSQWCSTYGERLYPLVTINDKRVSFKIS
jgi:hypothetical protein